ncbi:hypothetical protein nbrc107696_04600 [Gordonia spumicola]|uniref:Uncharacterized protein n=1 Tax=Gordonia spumicola TaxID=589161 RepID=A0A7I9V4B6_9ACTN|nr:hypothetical protein [Gordonia spumicola]GEE00014.1 hypothetical protein nbrc107696_04600 [Gordonia spumicola]
MYASLRRVFGAIGVHSLAGREVEGQRRQETSIEFAHRGPPVDLKAQRRKLVVRILDDGRHRGVDVLIEFGDLVREQEFFHLVEREIGTMSGHE